MTTGQLAPADTTIPIEAPTALPSYLPVPGMGVLPAHAFLVDGPEPMLVDTGPGGAEAGFQQALASVIDPEQVSWLWLTHTDPDHIGSLRWLLEAAPNMRVVTTYLAVGKLGMQLEVPMDRLYWANPGATLDIGGRRLEAIRPPSFDAPETTAFYDHTSRTLFSADTFGALLQSPVADAADVDADDLADGMVLWTTIDSPWVTHTDRDHFGRSLAAVQVLGAQRVLSSHLPPATGLTDVLVDTLTAVPDAEPWIGPDQVALEQILASVTA